MAVIDTPIPDKHEPWENYRGNRVEDYIKEQLDLKAGYFYPDSDNNKVLVFADEENKGLYLSDPATYSGLLIATLDIPSRNVLHIDPQPESYVVILTGTTGQYINFGFYTEDREDGTRIAEDVYCTYTFKRGSHTEVVNTRYTSGTSVSMNIDRYLLDGTNNITITLVGVQTLATAVFSVVYKVINLSLSDNLDISQTYGPSGTIAIPYTIAGGGMKYMEWFIDGSKRSHASEDDVPELEASKTKYIQLNGLSAGVHTLQFRAYVTENGENFYSHILYREFIVVGSTTSAPRIAVKGTILDGENGLVRSGSRITFNMLTQYVPYDLTMAVYNPSASTTSVDVKLDGTSVATVQVENGREAVYTITPMTSGNHTLTLKAGSTTASYSMVVAETTMNIHEITDNLVLDYSAVGKTNADRTWSYGSYTGTFHNIKWNETSGYSNNRLIIDAGSYFSIDYAPFANSLHATGLTLELEYSTLNVSDDDAVIMDLLTNGVGFKLTASEAALSSSFWKSAADPEKRALKKRFKSGENYRITYVINPYSGVTNHGLVFVYVNGRIGGARAYTEADSFISSKQLKFTGQVDAIIALKQIRIYNTALSSDQVLNNYMLYRDTLTEMQAIYDANDVLEGDTTSFDPYALAEAMPVMLLTGNIPALENEYQDKKKQIVVDVEYINMQDPTKSFTMTNATLTPQGTSSMAYPKKNFRLYTRKYTQAVLKDYEGNVIDDGLYSFRAATETQKAAQRVGIWCTKADYAESSSSHNTGIARLWNKVLFDAKVTYNATDPSHSVSNAYALRTQAQQAALDNDYEYDVRTCIDGFPICMFYRLTADSDYIFIGKYNFNNDKATESVFGFRDIDGFDSSNVECWEVLDNSNAIALFKTVSNFSTGFSDAFEARYPDDAGKPTEATRVMGALYDFCTWISSFANATPGSSTFATQKWAHLNVYMVAAYYVYLMTMGAVDQTTKNAMLTTEDGVHFYYINYDNDTILGVRNDGILAFPPTIDRQSLDPSYTTTTYAYAGHDNTLWNMLEGDTEFMAIVRAVYAALYAAGWNYSTLVDMFDNKQSLLWCERVFNQDADYKYLSPYRDAGTDHLEMLQGSRSSHRRWWISKRLALYDSLFVAGEFQSHIFQFKASNGTPANLQFTIKSGMDLYYGWGINSVIYDSGTFLEKGSSHTYTVARELAIGDPVSIYAGIYLKEVDIHQFLPYLSAVELTTVYSEETGVTSLTKLVIGATTGSNTSLPALSGLASVKKLEYLDIEGCQGLTSLDLTENLYITTLKAKRTNIGEVTFANGAYITNFEAPSSLVKLAFEGCSNITSDTISFQDGHGRNIRTISIRNCSGLADAWDLWWDWYNYKYTGSENCSVYIDGINWTGVSAGNLLSFGSISDLTLRGEIVLAGSITPETIDALKNRFGSGCFTPNPDLYIRTEEDYIALLGPDSVTEGQSAQYELIVITSKTGYVKYAVSGAGTHQASIGEDSGILGTTETGSASDAINVYGRFYYDGGMKQDFKTVSILKATYPTVDDVSIFGYDRITSQYTTYHSRVEGDFTGVITGEWTLTGELANYASIYSQGNDFCVIYTNSISSIVYAKGTLSYSFYKTIGGTATLIGTVNKEIVVYSDNLAVIRNINGPIMTALWNAYGTNGSQVASRGQKIANQDYVTKEEAAAFVGEDFNPTGGSTSSIFYAQRNNITNFDEFKYFTGVTAIPANCFYQCVHMKSIIFHTSLTSVGGLAFAATSTTGTTFASEMLENMEIDWPNVTSLGNGVFAGSGIKSFTAPSFTGQIPSSSFRYCKNLTGIYFENASICRTLQMNSNYACDIYIPNATDIKDYFFGTNLFPSNPVHITIGTVTAIQSYTWRNIPSGSSLTLSATCTSVPNSLRMHDSTVRYFAQVNVDPLNMTFVKVGDCVKQISNNELVLAPDIPTVTIDSSITRIGAYSFRGHTSVANINIHDAITYIGEYCFSGCKALTSLIIPSGVTTIGQYAFLNCTALEYLQIPATVTNSAQNRMSGTSLLKTAGPIGGGYDFEFGHNSGALPGFLFQTSSLKSIRIPDGITSINGQQFSGASYVEDLYLYRTTPPTMTNMTFGSSGVNFWMGKNVSGTKTVHVPIGATGYDNNDAILWLKNTAGYTISHDL